MSAGPARFFDAFIPYALGELGPDDLEALTGCAPSSSRGLAVYAAVVPQNLRFALGGMYPATKRACDADAPGSWSRLVDEFLARHPPRHADPNRCGDPFTAFLARRRERQRGSGQPEFLEELADYERIRFRASSAASPGPEETLFVRHYSHAVPAYVEDVVDDRGAAAAERIPQANPVTVIVFRSTKTLKAHFLYPTTAQLFAIGRRMDQLEGDLLVRAGLSDEDLAAADVELREIGVLQEDLA